MSLLLAGSRAPDFQLEGVNGEQYRLCDALGEGQVILVFFKSECPTCEFTLPNIQKALSGVAQISTRHALWGISEDDAAETRRFADQHGITFDLLIDEHPYSVSSDYGLETVPAIFVIEMDGTIALSDCGFSKSTLNSIAGFELFQASDGLPARRPGCRSKN